MTNKEIAKKFSLLGKIMELHGESPFKTKSYTNAYLNLRKLPDTLSEMSTEDISNIPGVGKAISSKIIELLNSGEMQTLNKYLELTPPGVVEMLGIKGFGPKKVKLVWDELSVESPGELLYAINENRLVDLKGFGKKTQDSLKDQLEYFLDSTDKQLLANIESSAISLLNDLRKEINDENFDYVGEVAMKRNVISTIDIITTAHQESINDFTSRHQLDLEDGSLIFCNCPLTFQFTSKDEYIYEKTRLSSTEEFFNQLSLKNGKYSTEEEVFELNELPYYIPEFRETENLEYLQNYVGAHNIIQNEHIKGCLHNHSTYSDGVNTIEEMVKAAEDKGYEYFGMTDHSKSAFYANGLSEERLMQQLDEIMKVDQKLSDIKLFSGIESDILSNGDLDYSDDILSELDIIVASVHSNLKMDIDKATHRLIKAIENPFTSILGHPTGRLLLSRKGYPIDYKKIIDACADNFVAIELNANPLRLDLDWRWINYAIEKDVLISINPDAHNIKGINDIYYGVCSARKAGLPLSHCLNAFDLEEFEEWLEEQHQKRG